MSMLDLFIDGTEQENNALPCDRHEAIAIVGTSCRLGNGINSILDLSHSLFKGEKILGPLPESFYDRNYDKLSDLHGGLIDDVFAFDPLHFGISPREANAMDPQQRLSLKLAWELFEDARITKSEYFGSNTGVYLGICENTYLNQVVNSIDPEVSLYLPTGNALNAIAGRISHCFNLSGPSLVIDTACSSSLMAISLAVRSLRAGECSAAIAGGINIMLDESRNRSLMDVGMLSKDGQCKVFDKDANGYVRSEGAGLVLLKRLSDAEKDQDKILGVIQGVAYNHNASSAGLTVPSGAAQTQVMKAAIDNAGLKVSDIDWIESHGTGTHLGDPIEFQAINSVFSNREMSQESGSDPVYITSSKSQFGHTESAAGVISLLKTLAVLKAGTLPKQFNFHEINPAIKDLEVGIKVPRADVKFENDKPIISGVNSFGFSGSNVSIIVKQYFQKQQVVNKIAQPIGLLCVSGSDDASLNANLKAINELLSEQNIDNTYALEALVNSAKTHLKYRAGFVYKNVEDLVSQLSHFQAESVSGVNTSELVFLFPGQGSQYFGMAYTLRQTWVIFADEFDQIIEKINMRLGRDLGEIMFGQDDGLLMSSTLYTQCALFSVGYALAKALIRLGIKPGYLIGHSVGEIAACAVAGVWAIDDACDIVVERGRLMEEPASKGSMLSISAELTSVENLIAEHGFHIDIAAVNAKNQIVVSAAQSKIDDFSKLLSKRNIPFVVLPVVYAFHSRLMTEAAKRLGGFIAMKPAMKPAYRIISGLTGKLEDILYTQPAYWQNQLLNKVDLFSAVRSICNRRPYTFIECGMNDVLVKCVTKIADRNLQHLYLHWEKPKVQAEVKFQNNLLALYQSGLNIDWNALYPREWLNCFCELNLRYQYNESDYRPVRLFMPEVNTASGEIICASSPILSSSTAESHFNLTAHGYLGDHYVFGECVAPGAMHCVFVLDALQRIYGTDVAYEIKDVYFLEVAVCSGDEDRTIQTVFTQSDEGIQFTTLSFIKDGNQFLDVIEHAKGIATKIADSLNESETTVRIANDLAADAKKISGDTFYHKLNDMAKMELGPSFRWCRSLSVDGLKAIADFEQAADALGSPFNITPGLLDTCYQIIGCIPLMAMREPKTYVPFSVEKVTVADIITGTKFRCFAEVITLPTEAKSLISGNAILVDEQGRTVIKIEGLIVKQIEESRFLRRIMNPDPDPSLYKYEMELDCQVQLDGFSFTHNKQELQCLSSVFDKYEQLNLLAALYARMAIKTVDYASVQSELAQKQWLRLNEIVNTASLDVILSQNYSGKSIEYALASELKRIRIQHPDLTAELDLIELCGPHIESVLTGDVAGTSVLFPVSDASIVGALYTDSELSKIINNYLAESFAQSIKDNGINRKIRILEIGGGTGGTTTYILDSLRDFDIDYTFTDVSPLFVSQASHKFCRKCDQYKVLDIEKDLTLQGFSSSDYDFVIAANVIHAARDIGIALSNVNDLLRPGGGFVLLEGSGKQPWLDVTFGLTDGWWHFSDLRMESGYPLLDVKQWFNVFETHGFSQPDLSEQEKLLPQVVYQVIKCKASEKADKTCLVISTPDSEQVARQFSDQVKSMSGIVHYIQLAVTGDLNSTKALSVEIGKLYESHGKLSLIYINGNDQEKLLDNNDFDGIKKDLYSMLALTQLVKRSLHETIDSFTLINIAADTQLLQPGFHEAALKTLSFETLSENINYIDTDVINSDLVDDYIFGHKAASIFYRAGERYIRKIVSADISQLSKTDASIVADKSYIVTGASSALSDSVVQWLIAQGAKRIDLVSRSAIDFSARAWGNEMQNGEVNIVLHQCDITDGLQVQQCIAKITSEGYEIDGIFHLAGLLENELIENQTESSLMTVIEPKVKGIINFLGELGEAHLNWFVMYSSAAAMLGSPGQLNHVIANAFLDSVVAHRRARGLSGLSIAWGPWGEIGSAVKDVSTSNFQEKGISGFTEKEGCEKTYSLLDLDLGYIAPINIDWKQFGSKTGNIYVNRSLDAALVNDNAASSPVSQKITYLSVAELNELNLTSRKKVITDLMILLLAYSLNIEPGKISIDDRIQDLGLDSLTAMEVMSRIKSVYGFDIPARIFLDNLMVEELASKILDILVSNSSAADESSDIMEGVL